LPDSHRTNGGILHYSRSAGLFLSGVIFSILGPVLAWAAFLAAAFRPGEGQVFFMAGFVAAGLGLLGFIQLIVSVYRAMRKIDAIRA